MQNRSRCVVSVLFGAVIFLCGCSGIHMYKIATGSTPFQDYGLPIYATENVPFEYEELGVVRVDAWVCETYPKEATYMTNLVRAAKELGADAIVRFKLENFGLSGGFMLVLSNGHTVAEGVAVKIKRP